MQLGNFIDVFLTRHVSGTYAHHQEHYMLSCSVGRVYGASALHTRPTQRLSRPPPIQISVQKTICCNSTFNAPDDGRMYSKHVELRIHQ